MLNLDTQQMQKVVSSFQVPIKPDILTSIQELMNEEEPDIAQISQLIANDVGMSSTILKIINSPFYGMNRRISDIKQAVMMLGLTTINSLVMALSLKESFKGQASISLERFWDDSMDVANAMLFLGQKVKSELPPDELYTLGLFHNCGIALLALKYSDYKNTLIEANNTQVNSIALEEEKYQTNHAVLGYFVAASWNLPTKLCQMILIHHDFQAMKSEQDSQLALSLAVLKAAEELVAKAKRHHESYDWPEIKEFVLDTVGYSEVDFADIEDDFVDLFNEVK
ncbi:HDOD domain-containing protein [Thalassotalea sp. G2M2-11]|uniref:HDOD domain-containing protein n=1 Tax=Thalassotalea sp. G2M2-11 TaxID=2787627 RepID=UPI0019D1AA23|nr:HDOD domain-containing protein [Thalassotalea sp. G2M2-11]